MSFQQFHYPVGVDYSLPCSQARVMADNYGFVSQLQALEFYLDTSVRLCGESIAAAHKVFIESQDVKAIDYARVCMFDCYSQVMHNYEALRVVDPWYLYSAVESLHGDLVQVDRNICSKLSSLWELRSNSVSQSRPSSRSLSDKVKLAEKVARGKAYISKRKAELLQEIDRQQQLLESMSALVSRKKMRLQLQVLVLFHLLCQPLVNLVFLQVQHPVIKVVVSCLVQQTIVKLLFHPITIQCFVVLCLSIFPLFLHSVQA